MTPRPGDKVRCSGCGAKVRIPDDLPVEKARCPRCRTPLSGRPRGDLPATIGSYRVRRRLASGGMGVVYEAASPVDDHLVAIKVLLPDALQDENLVARFKREGSLGMALQHPNLVRVIECGEDGASRYLVCELVDGPSLSRHVKRTGPMGWRETLEVMQGVLEAMIHLAGAGVIHRDLKPANVLIGSDGVAKVADLGLAKCLDDSLIEDEQESRVELQVLTLAGDQLGTPSYMAPEQVQDSSVVDHRVDIYGVGATMFFCLTGEPPFRGKSAVGVMEQVLRDPPPRVRELVHSVPEALDEVIDWCLAKDPDDRPADCHRLQAMLERVIDEPEDVSAILEQRRDSRFTPPWMSIMAGTAVVVIIAACLVYWFLVR